MALSTGYWRQSGLAGRETKTRTSIQLAEELLVRGRLHIHWMRGRASTRCTELYRRLSKARERKVIPFLAPVQTVWNEKDKFRDYCAALWMFTYGFAEEWYIMLSNDWGQFNGTGLGLHCPCLCLPLSRFQNPSYTRILLGWHRALGMAPWYSRGRKSTLRTDKAHHGDCFSTMLDSNIHSSLQTKYSAHHF